MAYSGSTAHRENILSTKAATPMADIQPATQTRIIFNSNGLGYGQFPGSLDNLQIWNQLLLSLALQQLQRIYWSFMMPEKRLELLQEIQITGDIFFPKNWLDATLENYNSPSAVHTVTAFLHERPDYNEQLRMKILQSADMMTRANRIISASR
jgi:hypothetical protein